MRLLERRIMSAPNSLSLKNARIILEASCLAKLGESVLIITDRTPKRMACALALETAASDLGLIPVIMDVSAYGRLCEGKSTAHWHVTSAYDPQLLKSLMLKPVKNAIEAADIVILTGTSWGMRPNYSFIFGTRDADDAVLDGRLRRFQLLGTEIDEWELTTKEVTANRRRTLWLMDRLRAARRIRITSPAGTDFTAGLGPEVQLYPILALIPFYYEVAIVPKLGPEMEGVYVVDGTTERDVRLPKETDRTPLRVVVKEGRVQDVSGDAEQVARLKKLIVDTNSSEVTIDEIGLVTTSFAANDAYWGEHHWHNIMHIALGNNVRRGEIVHGSLHMDGAMRRATVSLDGQVIIRDGVFVDSVMDQ
jgi:hypothetical protein